MKGIVLAGGTGSRLWPITKSISKQLLPVYDKPMIYYPIATLMLAGIRQILIITTPSNRQQFELLLQNGSQIGVSISYETQEEPRGIAQAFTIAENFLNEQPCMLVLGDNIFHGAGLGYELSRSLPHDGARIFTYEVNNPSDYGVLEIDSQGNPISIEEKPKKPKSNFAVTGLYFFDKDVSSIAKEIKPSSRGELEITSLIDNYLMGNKLKVTKLSRGTVWLDTGNPKTLHDASSYVRVIEERTGLKIGCPEEIAFRNNWISKTDLIKTASAMGKGRYSEYLLNLVENNIQGS
jgi:glucose-1-phosphate thymidylyltransferase